MSGKDRRKTLPVLTTDEEAERFVETADLTDYDLTDYDLTGFKPMHFEFEKKAAQINMRVPKPLLDAVKTKAKARGIPFTRYIRELIERDISRR